MVPDQQGESSEIWGWVNQIIEATNNINTRLAQTELVVQQNAENLGGYSGAINSLARRITDASQNMTQTREIVDSCQQSLGRMAQSMEPAALRDWLTHTLKNDPDVRVQISQIVADWLKISEKNLETRMLEKMGVVRAESQSFTENYARMVGSEVQRNSVSRTDSIMSKLEQVTSKTAEMHAKVTLLESGAQRPRALKMQR